jgi:hypothetical protein
MNAMLAKNVLIAMSESVMTGKPCIDVVLPLDHHSMQRKAESDSASIELDAPTARQLAAQLLNAADALDGIK